MHGHQQDPIIIQDAISDLVVQIQKVILTLRGDQFPSPIKKPHSYSRGHPFHPRKGTFTGLSSQSMARVLFALFLPPGHWHPELRASGAWLQPNTRLTGREGSRAALPSGTDCSARRVMPTARTSCCCLHPCCPLLREKITQEKCVIPALWGAGAGGLQVWIQPEQFTDLMRSCFKIKIIFKKGLGM